MPAVNSGAEAGSGDSPDPSQLRDWLSRSEIHEEWIGIYYTPENERFYEQVFDVVESILPGSSKGGRILDAGCGDGAHSVRLARRGFRVEAVDVSRRALERARSRLHRTDAGTRVRLHQGSLLELPFADAVFDHLLCWGVLMHIADVHAALDELVRVVSPGGTLVISESNMRSLESRLLRFLRKFKDSESTLRRTPAGVEHWGQEEGKTTLFRDADIPWLKSQLQARGCELRTHRAGQLTEIYTRLPRTRVNRIFHAVNRLWFNYTGWPAPAKGNILVFEKTAPSEGPSRTSRDDH